MRACASFQGLAAGPRIDPIGVDLMSHHPSDPRDPQQLRLPFDDPECPRCHTTRLIEYDDALDLYVCSACANSWRVPVDEQDRRS
jgi:hypothetical protein